MKTPAIEALTVTKYRGAIAVLNKVSFQVPSGQVVAVLGPSGAGKSTLLRCINHLETIDAGKLLVDGEIIGYEERDGVLYELPDATISKQRQRIGMVFQSFNLFRHITVIENVMAGPIQVLGQSRSQASELARDLLVRVGLAEKAHAFPNQLSGGQQQRVAIARALAMRPTVKLLDEPTSALDPELSHEVIAAIRRLADDGITLMIATHEMSLARGFADRVMFMVQGELVEDQPSADFFKSPTHERARQFLLHHT